MLYDYNCTMAGSTMIDLTGSRFGRLVVLRRDGSIKTNVAWRCLCDCGQESRVSGNRLRSGHTMSCGCLLAENRKRGTPTHGMSHTRLFRAWTGMKTRCTNPMARSWPHYGGRGIRLCKEWSESFEAFRDWSLSYGYSDNLSIDRIDVDGHYTPENCRWATPEQQANNKTVGRLPDGRRVSDVARQNGIKMTTVRMRVSKGVPIDVACEAPTLVNSLPLLSDGRTVREAAAANGIKYGTAQARIAKGWSADRACTEPLLRRSRQHQHQPPLR